MKSRQKISLLLLILGLLFSGMIRVRFNISDGFEFHNVWVTWIPSFFDFALVSSKEHALTTTFLGYFFFIISGLLMVNNIKNIGRKDIKMTAFLGLTAFALLFELISLAQDLFTSYYGQHMRISLLLFLFGIILYSQMVHSSKNMEAFHRN